MKIKAKYVTNKCIDIFIEGVTPSDPQWEAIRATLEKAKFSLNNGFAYRRDFDNPDEFSKWLKNTTKLTTQFGGTEPVEVQDPLQSMMEMITEFESRYNELYQEVVSLKKFDAIAQQKLSELRSKLDQVDKKPPARRKKK